METDPNTAATMGDLRRLESQLLARIAEMYQRLPEQTQDYTDGDPDTNDG